MLMFAFFHIFKLKEFDLEAHLGKRKQLICLLEFNKKSYVLGLNLSIYLSTYSFLSNALIKKVIKASQELYAFNV